MIPIFEKYLQKINLLTLDKRDTNTFIDFYQTVFEALRQAYEPKMDEQLPEKCLKPLIEGWVNPKYIMGDFCPNYLDDWYDNDIQCCYGNFKHTLFFFNENRLRFELYFSKNQKFKELSLKFLNENLVSEAFKFCRKEYSFLALSASHYFTWDLILNNEYPIIDPTYRFYRDIFKPYIKSVQEAFKVEDDKRILHIENTLKEKYKNKISFDVISRFVSEADMDYNFKSEKEKQTRKKELYESVKNRMQELAKEGVIYSASERFLIELEYNY